MAKEVGYRIKDYIFIYRRKRITGKKIIPSFNFFCYGLRCMHVGFNLAFYESNYDFDIRVPFGKWLRRKKCAEKQKEIDCINKKFDFFGKDALYFDDYGHVTWENRYIMGASNG